MLPVLVLLSCESPYATRPQELAPPGIAETPPPSSVTDPTPVTVPLGGSRGEGTVADAPPEDGFVVWESNRSGPWRLWIRALDGFKPRQLTPDEDGRQHCCAHIAPDGDAVVYLSLPTGQERYPESGATGVLHLIAPDGSDDRAIVDEARTYYEHRAAVWRAPDELILIGGDGRTLLHDLESASSRPLTHEPLAAHGFLVDSTLRHATAGTPSFPEYDAERGRVEPRRDLGGCQPYFSHDGRWGFWIAGAGGPIRALDLATRRQKTVVAKSDPRLPADQGYLYFPMLSSDGRLLAFAASRDEHSHHTADYDVFVAETDPETLDVIGPMRRFTADPATDRFPDVFSAPLALGRHFAEAPFTLELTVSPRGDSGGGKTVSPPGNWRFTANGEEIGRGQRLRHRFTAPGSYEVRAERDGETLLGRVTVRPGRPPEVAGIELRGGRRLIVTFDEEVDDTDVHVAFGSGREIVASTLRADRRALVVELEADLDAADVLTLAGIRDRGEEPRVLAETRLEIEPPSWPMRRDGLVFLWQTDHAANEVVDAASGAARVCLTEPTGFAWKNRHGALVLGGGAFWADRESADAVLAACRRTSELSVEAFVMPQSSPPLIPPRGQSVLDAPSRILTFSGGERQRNFTLGQEGDRLVFRLRTRTTGPNADRPQIDLGPVAIGRPSHVVVTYTPGRLIAYVNGEKARESDVITSGFHHWKQRPLLVGNESRNVERPWYGTVEGMAIYNRVLSAEEVAENHRRYRALVAARPAVDRWRIRARLERRSPIPTLEEISPYRSALAVFDYRVLEVLEGDAGRLRAGQARVVHHVLLDADRTPIADLGRGAEIALDLEPFAGHAQLESLVLSDARPGASELFFAPRITP